MRRIIQLGFWVAVIATLYLTLRPPIMVVPASDKTQHMITFAMLALVATAGYPRARLFPVLAALSGLGAAIEIIQPYFGRDAELLDWVADSAGLIIAGVLILIFRQFWPNDRNDPS